MSIDKVSPDLNSHIQKKTAQLEARESKSFFRKSFESGLLNTNTESREFNESLMKQQVNENPASMNINELSCYIFNDLNTNSQGPSISKSIKSSKDLYYRFMNDEHQEADEKFNNYMVYRKYSDSNIESRATSLLNLQIKDLEHRTKSSRLSTSSQRQIQVSEFEDHNTELGNNCRQIPTHSYLNDELAGSRHLGQIYINDKEDFPYPNSGFQEYDYNLYPNDNSINKQFINKGLNQRTQENQTMTINEGNHAQDTETTQSNHEKIINNNVINYNPIISNNYSCCHHPANLDKDTSSPDAILENYYYHLRQLQHYHLMYLGNLLNSADVIPGNLKINDNEDIETKEISASNSPAKSATGFSAGFMYGKQGWVCHSCKNFNFESRTKCNRCNKLPFKVYHKNEILNEGSDKEAVQAKVKKNIKESYKKEGMISKPMDDQSKKGKHHERAGDWVCAICKNLNFSFRNKCNRCQANKEENIEKSKDMTVNCNFRQPHMKPQIQYDNLLVNTFPPKNIKPNFYGQLKQFTAPHLNPFFPKNLEEATTFGHLN